MLHITVFCPVSTISLSNYINHKKHTYKANNVVFCLSHPPTPPPISVAGGSALAAVLEYYFHPELSVFPTRSRLWLIKWASSSPPAYSHLLPSCCFCSTCLSLGVSTSVSSSPYSHSLVLDSTVAPFSLPTCMSREFLSFPFLLCSVSQPLQSPW